MSLIPSKGRNAVTATGLSPRTSQKILERIGDAVEALFLVVRWMRVMMANGYLHIYIVPTKRTALPP